MARKRSKQGRKSGGIVGKVKVHKPKGTPHGELVAKAKTRAEAKKKVKQRKAYEAGATSTANKDNIPRTKAPSTSSTKK